MSRVVKEVFELSHKSGEKIHGDIRYTGDSEKKPVLVICHGFMAFKDWGFFPYVAECVAKSGCVSVIFNFSHNGVVRDQQRITDFAKFESNTISHELEDIRLVVDAVYAGEIGFNLIDKEKIVLFGHSRGGGEAIVHTASDRRIKALVTWSAVSTFDRWTHHQKEQWKKLGYLPLAKDSTVSLLRMGIRFLTDLEMNSENLNITHAASRVNASWLLIHGKMDGTIPCYEAERLHEAANKSTTELILLEKVGHLYNAASRDEDNYKTIDKLITLTTRWLHEKLS
ncbi:MAG: acetylxylan esterase [Ignavibacteriae bacterium]|nr:acetylxylan esterase [Ignavibacteriota bacterium]